MISELAAQKADWDVRLADKETALRAKYTAWRRRCRRPSRRASG